MASFPLLNAPEVVTTFCGGILSPDRLTHPEGVCVDPRDGSLWCGGEGGELYHISPDGTRIEKMACTGGFLLGVTIDCSGRLYLCDLHHRCVFVIDDHGRELARLEGRDGDECLQLPNFAVLSHDESLLYVSDTRRSGGPGVWRFDLANGGTSTLWMRESCLSANGLALAPDGKFLYLVESHLPGVSRIPILADGSAGPKELFLLLPGDEPDGLAFSSAGDLWISIYNPTRILRCCIADKALDCIVADDTTDHLHHATNIVFRGENELFVSNFGAWHLSRINLTSLPK